MALENQLGSSFSKTFVERRQPGHLEDRLDLGIILSFLKVQEHEPDGKEEVDKGARRGRCRKTLNHCVPVGAFFFFQLSRASSQSLMRKGKKTKVRVQAPHWKWPRRKRWIANLMSV